MYPIETTTQNTSVHRFACICISVICLLAFTAAAYANTDTEADVDSVYSWGIWELGLEPASGPVPAAGKAMNDRSRRLKFRPNDNAAYTIQSIPVPQTVTIAPPSPIPVAQPSATPPMPLAPPGFSSGPATTTDPRN